MNTPVLDEVRLRAVSGGDRFLELELIEMLLEEAEPLVASVQSGISDENIAIAHEASHALKGIAGNVGAAELREAATSLDTALDGTRQSRAHLAGLLEGVHQAMIGLRAVRAARAARVS